MIDRIYKSYNRELKDYPTQPKEYQICGIWTGAEDAKITKEQLYNFGSDPIGNGLSLGKTIPNRENMENMLKAWRIMTNLSDSDKVLEYPQQFGFKGLFLNNIFTIVPSFRLSYFAYRISQLSEKNVVEIGGGFGGVPYHLFKDFKFLKTYLNFDIPYVGLIAKYFLMTIFPERKFLLYGEDDIKNFEKYDMVLMPHYMIKDLPNNCCDLVVNSHSLSEMGTTQIKEYFRQIDRISTKWFLHFNHDFQVYPQKESNGFLEDIDRNNPIILSQIKMPNWKMICMFPEILIGDEEKVIPYHEYLYEKK